LLAPDVSEDAVRALLASGAGVQSAVLELPHDGAQAANPPEFLAAVRPQVAVVNLEAGSRSALPHPDTLARVNTGGAVPLYRTDQQGTIEIVTDGRTLRIHTAR
jgi:competence protein ComEC